MSVYAASRVRKKNNFKAEDASDVKEDAGYVETNADDVEEDANELQKMTMVVSSMVERP